MPRPVANPPNPWLSTHVEYLDEPPPAALEVYEEEARSILSENDSPDLGFAFSLNPYRGCFHACAYCYARPTHQYLGFGAGTDFDRKLVVKVNAPELLRARLRTRSWQGAVIALSGNTDCYQPLEVSYELTRRCLQECLEVRNPVAVITKSSVIRRDAALLGELATRARAQVTISIPFARDDLARAFEPYASPPSRRFETLRILADAGVSVGVSVSPIIPGLNDADLAEILERAHAAGARHAFKTMLRLPGEVREVFQRRLREAVSPERARRVEHAVEELRGGDGRMNDGRFGARFVGQGPRWAAIDALFEQHRRRLGMVVREVGVDDGPTTYQRPGEQLRLL